MLPNIHILGIQGSGKGYQSALLVERYAFNYLASGNLFRERSAVGDAFSQEITTLLKSGHLLPDSYLFRTVREYLAEHRRVKYGLLCDGVIRTLKQYHGLEPLWKRYKLDDPLLIHLRLSEAEAVKRTEQRRREQDDPSLQQHHLKYSGKLLQRTDDNPAAIKERFALYHTMTEPVIRRLEAEGRCIHINADANVEEIQAEICQNLEKLYPELHNVTH